MSKTATKNFLLPDQLEGRQSNPALVASIEEHGVMNPIKVYKTELGLAVLDGYRRIDALFIIDPEGDIRTPYELIDAPESEEERKVMQVVLNRNRKDIKPTHVASSIMLLKQQGERQKNIARKFGLSEPEVSMYLTLERGHEKLKRAVDSGRISLSAIEPLLTKPYAVQENLADTAIRSRTVRAVRALVKTHEMKSDITASTTQLEENIDPLEYLALEELKNIETILVRLNNQEIESGTIRIGMTNSLDRIRTLARKLELDIGLTAF